MTLMSTPSSDFLETELLASFTANPIAVQLAAFQGLKFENGTSVVIEFNLGDIVANTLTFVVDGERKAQHEGVGQPCQYYEWFAHIVNKYAECNNTKVVTYG